MNMRNCVGKFTDEAYVVGNDDTVLVNYDFQDDSRYYT